MPAWNDDDLRIIDAQQEVDIAPVRRNGELRRATPIWIVRVGDDLYVRGAYGANKGWHGVARTSHRGRLEAGGSTFDVGVEDADPGVLDAVDAAYRDKYGRYASIVDSITSAEHRASTLRLLPAGS